MLVHALGKFPWYSLPASSAAVVLCSLNLGSWFVSTKRTHDSNQGLFSGNKVQACFQTTHQHKHWLFFIPSMAAAGGNPWEHLSCMLQHTVHSHLIKSQIYTSSEKVINGSRLNYCFMKTVKGGHVLSNCSFALSSFFLIIPPL